MSCREDSSFCDAVIDSLKFARDARSTTGAVPVVRLGRLADQLADATGTLACELNGGIDGEGKPFLDLKVRGGLQLRCQRCLAPMPFALAVDSRLTLVAPGEQWPDEELADDGPDAIEASRELAVLTLVEDEVLLALPIAPRHDVCRPPSNAAAVEQDECRPSPFAVLAGLKDH